MDKKNLVSYKVVTTKQTRFHLLQLCAMCGWNEKNIGRAIDKVMRAYRTEGRPVGKWLYHKGPLGTYCICSVCHSVPASDTRYCPECGSLMKGEHYAQNYR